MPVTLERDPILFFARYAPFLGGDLSVLAHALAGRAIRHGRNMEPDIAQPQVRQMRGLLPERPGVLKLPDPIGEGLAQPQLDAAHALRTADEREMAVDAIDHSRRL